MALKYISLSACGLLALCLSAGVGVATGSGGNENAKIQIFLRGSTDYRCSNSNPVYQPRCSNITTSGTLYPKTYYAHVLVTDGNADTGVGGLEFGIDYDNATASGVDLYFWVTCAYYETQFAGVNGPWPSALSGNRLVWNTETYCQRFEPGGPGTGVVASAGLFYCAAYSSDDLKITVYPGTGVATVLNCSSVVDTVEGGGIVRNPSHLGYGRFSSSGLEPGYNPCGLNTAVDNKTWSGIKTLLR